MMHYPSSVSYHTEQKNFDVLRLRFLVFSDDLLDLSIFAVLLWRSFVAPATRVEPETHAENFKPPGSGTIGL